MFLSGSVQDRAAARRWQACEVSPLVSMSVKPASNDVAAHPVYDCIYVVAARAENCQLITSDAKFVAKLAGTSFEKDVVLLADW